MLPNTRYDVVIGGAGPGGLLCAKTLAEAGVSVLVLEKNKTPGEPNFSTAWVPATALTALDVNPGKLAYPFRRMSICAAGATASWETPTPFGYVLDFAGWKRSLEEKLVTHPTVTILLGATVQQCRMDDLRGATHIIYNKEGKREDVRATYVVDATGSNAYLLRSVTGKTKPRGRPSIGFEKIISAQFDPWYRERIALYFGSTSIPHGYIWISWFGEDRYKIGACVADYRPGFLAQNLEKYLDDFLARKGMGKYTTLETHGGTISVTGRLGTLIYKNLLVVGDAANMINPLFGEGVRHAAASGKLAAQTILDHIAGRGKLTDYSRKIAGYKKEKWLLCRLAATLLYHGTSDAAKKKLVNALSRLSVHDAARVGFYYELHRVLKYLL